MVSEKIIGIQEEEEGGLNSVLKYFADLWSLAKRIISEILFESFL